MKCEIEMVKAIFVVGTGRSGTHFLCRSLGGFRNVVDPLKGHENAPILRQIALSAIHHHQLPNRVIEYYEKAKMKLGPKDVFLDQHHPNIFFFDNLLSVFEDILFLCPRRPLVQVVASMLQHNGALSWIDYAKESFKRQNADSCSSVSRLYTEFSSKEPVPMPNQFLGVTGWQQLFEADLYLLCAFRVLSHYQTMIRLQSRDSRCRFLGYENLINTPENELKSVFSADELEQLGQFEMKEKADKAPLSKFRSVLTADQINRLEEIESEFDRNQYISQLM